ncbi:hypothetical protein DFH06DRAFT_1198501 [Mycena polygramma]|nr:hypothetical protein DFH06DRAFT_1198501 [Mycena polygramma]
MSFIPSFLQFHCVFWTIRCEGSPQIPVYTSRHTLRTSNRIRQKSVMNLLRHTDAYLACANVCLWDTHGMPKCIPPNFQRILRES